MAHIYNGILLSHEKEWNNAPGSNMDGPGDYHSKWKSQMEQDKYHMISHIQMNLFIKQKQTHRLREWTSG